MLALTFTALLKHRHAPAGAEQQHDAEAQPKAHPTLAVMEAGPQDEWVRGDPGRECA